MVSGIEELQNRTYMIQNSTYGNTDLVIKILDCSYHIKISPQRTNIPLRIIFPFIFNKIKKHKTCRPMRIIIMEKIVIPIHIF